MQAPPTTRAPLLWFLVPLILGITLVHWMSNTWVLLLLGSGLGTGTLGFIYLKRKRLTKPAYGLLVLGGILLSAAYTLSQTPVFPRDEPLPPREAFLSLKITRLFSREDPYHRQGGIALIEEAPKHLQELQGQKVSFFLKKQNNRPSPKRGETWTALGVLDSFPQKPEPFSFAFTQKNEGIYFSLNRGIFLERTHEPGPFTFYLTQSALWLKNILSQGTPAKAEGVYMAMLLGDKQKLDPQTKAQFIQTGTLHLFAISGLHIGVIAFALFTLLRWFKLPRIANTCTGLSLLLLYVLIIGASPSALRAFLMIFFLWGAYSFKRRPAPFSALVASALCVLLINPLQLWSPGFQLSYSVVTGILLYGLPLAGFFKKRLAPDNFIPTSEIPYWKRSAIWIKTKLLESSAITLSATLLSAPLILAYFKMFSPGAFLLNLILIPLASLTITLGFASLICGILFIPIIPTLLNQLAALCILGLKQSVSWGLKIPYIFWEANSHNAPLTLMGILGLLTLLICTRPCMNKNGSLRLLGPIIFAALWAIITINPASLQML